MKKIVEIRNKLKAKKPTFTRHDAHKKARVGTGWRRPKGRQNKMRLHKRGYARDRSSGFGSPRAAYALSREGFTQNVIAKVADFSGLDAKNDGIIIARTTGNRRKAELVAYATTNGFTLLNIDPVSFKKSLDSSLATKAAKKKELTKKRSEKDAATKKAAEKEQKKAEKAKTSNDAKKEDVSEDVKKLQETQSSKTAGVLKEEALLRKKEHDKLLTKEN